MVASLAAVAFQLAINWIYIHCLRNFAAGSFAHFAAISLALIVFASLIAGWLLYSFCPEAAGSGIPQVKLAYWKEFGYAPRRIASIKFVAGVLSIGAGFSLGREGPTVQIGSNLASTLSGWLGVSKQNRRAASAAGAAAGLAAAFNAPLASVAFVLEEIIGDLNSRSLGPVLLAAGHRRVRCPCLHRCATGIHACNNRRAELASVCPYAGSGRVRRINRNIFSTRLALVARFCAKSASHSALAPSTHRRINYMGNRGRGFSSHQPSRRFRARL